MSKYNGFYGLLFLFSTVMVASVESQDRDQRFTHSFSASVESEEILYSYVTPDNGSNPMWCFGNSCIVRYGDRVFSSGSETIPGAEPRNNTRWTLFYNDGNNWELLLRDTIHRTREPSPLALFSNGSLLLSVNPTLTDPDVFAGPSEPRVLQFSAREPSAGFEVLHPAWDGETKFTEHSYRSFAVDGDNHEMILFQNSGDGHAEWSFFSNGSWISFGELVWPWGDTYEEPEPVRICYPAVQIRNRAVHFLGVSDIVEPNKSWRDFKYKLTGRKWDYDFRRLFYIYSPDITSGEFSEWIEIASRENTGGHIFPCDLWVGPDGLVHILWTEKALDERLRNDFFPDEIQSWALNYGVISDGELIVSKPLMRVVEDEGSVLPGRGRFHTTPDNRLFVLYFVEGSDGYGDAVKENRLVEIYSDHTTSKYLKVELTHPLATFFTTSVRSGSAPSEVIDILGDDGNQNMRYARIRLHPD